VSGTNRSGNSTVFFSGNTGRVCDTSELISEFTVVPPIRCSTSGHANKCSRTAECGHTAVWNPLQVRGDMGEKGCSQRQGLSPSYCGIVKDRRDKPGGSL